MADNIGQFGAAIGSGSALAEAMTRRGDDVSALQVQSTGSAGGAPPIPQDPSQVQAAQAAIPGAPAPAPTPSAPPAPPSDPELSVALEALAGFTKGKIGIQKDLVKGRMQGLL